MVKSSGIEIMREEDAPRVVCPHCKNIINIDLMGFRNSISKIMKDNCPKCGGEIFVGVLILAHPSAEGLAQSVMAVMDTLTGHHTLIDGKHDAPTEH